MLMQNCIKPIHFDNPVAFSYVYSILSVAQYTREAICYPLVTPTTSVKYTSTVMLMADTGGKTG